MSVRLTEHAVTIKIFPHYKPLSLICHTKISLVIFWETLQKKPTKVPQRLKIKAFFSNIDSYFYTIN